MDEQTVRTQAKRHGYKLRKRGEAWPELSEEDAKRLDEAYRSGEF